ncbi:hypothetical protein DYBT9275_03069 [Dyadobacter sp. CECT 9275]|uniref:Uncharacterized protein n=1 Tax=Dyadobacter helix TaxID=2822344 RepID=A0A916NC96_9BACT|nr:hypothetical protein [Dyadobacter sp. CECT 9275]CAG5003140.1 hypothetical protein DYBT9275_03069 [Dyadobacter sp. CECT 9275]
MIPIPLENQRKGVIGLFIWLLLFFLVLILIAVRRNEWDAVAGLSGAAIAVIPAIMAYDTIFQARIEKLPQLDIIIDITSRYSLFQLVIVNNGGSAAYNINLTWLDKEQGSGRPLPIPFNLFGQPISFSKDERYNVIRLLSKGQSHHTVIDGYYPFYERYPEEAFFMAKLSYSEDVAGNSKMEIIIPVSLDEFRSTLDYHTESSKTNYELQQLPKKLDKIKSALDNITCKLDTGRKKNL